jgi:hypothetical protein
MANQSAVQAEITLKHAQEIGRQAAALEVQASTLEAEAEKIAPQSGEVQLEIDRLTSQKELLDQAREATVRRADGAKAHAQVTADEAHAAAQKLATLVQGLDEQREKELAPQTEKALSTYEAAAGAAKKAGTDAKGTSQMATGGVRQHIGDVQWGRAQGLTAYAEVMEGLAAAQPALPESSKYKASATKARADAEEALKQATESYKAAKTAYESAGGGASVQERIKTVTDRLAEIVKITSGGTEDISDHAATEAPAAPAAETPAATASADGDSPRVTLQKLKDMAISGDFSKAAELFALDNEQDREAITQALTLVGKMAALDKAMKAKFGSGLAGEGAPPGMKASPFEGLAKMDVATIQVTVEGDKATAQIPGESQPTSLVKKNGKWLLDPKNELDPAARAQLAMVAPLSKAVDEVIADIKSGKLKSAQEVQAAIAAKMLGGNLPTRPPGGK